MNGLTSLVYVWGLKFTLLHIALLYFENFHWKYFSDKVISSLYSRTTLHVLQESQNEWMVCGLGIQ